jgi:hypothetical protein
MWCRRSSCQACVESGGPIHVTDHVILISCPPLCPLSPLNPYRGKVHFLLTTDCCMQYPTYTPDICGE